MGGYMPKTTGSKKVGTREKDELIHSLKDENAQLRAQLEKLQGFKNRTMSAPQTSSKETPELTFDCDSNTFSACNLKGKDIIVDRMRIQIDGTAESVTRLLSVEALANREDGLPLGEMVGLGRKPMKVKDFQLRLPEKSSTHFLNITKGEQLKKEGFSELQISYLPDNKIELTGKVKKLVNIPFDLKARVSATREGKIKLTPSKLDILGFLPVPKFLTKLLSSVAYENSQDPSIKQEGDSFLIDSQSLVPSNVSFKLEDIRTENGNLILEGGEPLPEK